MGTPWCSWWACKRKGSDLPGEVIALEVFARWSSVLIDRSPRMSERILWKLPERCVACGVPRCRSRQSAASYHSCRHRWHGRVSAKAWIIKLDLMNGWFAMTATLDAND